MTTVSPLLSFALGAAIVVCARRTAEAGIAEAAVMLREQNAGPT